MSHGEKVKCVRVIKIYNLSLPRYKRASTEERVKRAAFMDSHLYHQFFEKEDTHWWFVARNRIIMDMISRRVRLPEGSRILDVGCGTGGMLATMARAYHASGIDPSPLAIAYCRKRGLSDVTCGTLDNLAPRSPGFDLITLLDVIEHVFDDGEMLSRSHGLLRPGGHALVTVPAYPFLWSEHDVANHHYRRYWKGQLIARLRKAGFRVLQASYLNSLLLPAVLGMRWLAKFRKSGRDGTLDEPRPWISLLLQTLFASERYVLRCGSLPAGTSILALAQKRPADVRASDEPVVESEGVEETSVQEQLVPSANDVRELVT
jgi:2-polyprenyl-3-methyl-5-hydroxy-6-metoxy-1,4-benzoquinol methylase